MNGNVWCFDQTGLKHHVVDYFASLYWDDRHDRALEPLPLNHDALSQSQAHYLRGSEGNTFCNEPVQGSKTRWRPSNLLTEILEYSFPLPL